MAELIATQSVENLETKLNEAVNSIESLNLKQAMQNIKDLIWLKKDFINDMDEINQDDFENFAQSMKVIESNEAGINLVKNLLNANFTNASELRKYQKENSAEFSDLADFNLCFLRFYGKYVESEDFGRSFFEEFLYNVKEENMCFLAYSMVRECSSIGGEGNVFSTDFLKKMGNEKQNAVFWSYFAIKELLQKIARKEKFYNKNFSNGYGEMLIDSFPKLISQVIILGKDRFNKFLYEKMLKNAKELDDFMDAWFTVKKVDFDFENWDSICELMQDWERVYENIKLIKFMKLFINNFEVQQEIKTVCLNFFNEFSSMSFIDLYNLDFGNVENCKNCLNEKIDNSSLEDKENIKELFDNNIFHSRFFKKAIEDEEFLNFVSKDDKSFQALKRCYNENSRLFYNRDVTCETKAKVTLIKEGEFFRDDTALNIPLKKDEVDRSSVMVRMDKRPELEGNEIVILFELSSRSWWWNRSLCLNLNKESFTKLAKITEKVSNQKEFLDWIYSNRKKLIVKNRGENSNTLVTNFEELAQNAGFFILSENQKKVFDRIPEENREEFKNNFTQCPEFRATVEILGKTITDTESFIKLYSSFFWAYNLLSLNIQLSCAMQLVMGNVMENFLSVQKTEDVKFINETLNNLKPNLKHDEVPRIESQLTER